MNNFVFVLLLSLTFGASAESFQFQGHVTVIPAPEDIEEPPATEVCEETEDSSEGEPQCVIEVVYE